MSNSNDIITDTPTEEGDKDKKKSRKLEIALIIVIILLLLSIFFAIWFALHRTTNYEAISEANAALAADEGSASHIYVDYALSIARNVGYEIEKMTPTEDGYCIVWDEANNRFALVSLNDDGSINKWLYFDETTGHTTDNNYIWFFTEDYTEADAANNTNGYSYYLKELTTLPTELDVSCSLSVGNNNGISIYYESTDTVSVTFVTSSGTLTVDNPNATVTHYGFLTGLDLIAYADYYEYGTVNEQLSGANVTVNTESSEETTVTYKDGTTGTDSVVTLNEDGTFTVLTVDPTNLNRTDGEVDLDCVYTFNIIDTMDEVYDSDYRYWNVDYVVYVDQDVDGEDYLLAGQYDTYSDYWLALGGTDDDDVTAYTPVRLLLDMMGLTMNYEEIGSLVGTFQCGAYYTGTAKPVTLTVELRLYETIYAATGSGSMIEETGNYLTVDTQTYTWY